MIHSRPEAQSQQPDPIIPFVEFMRATPQTITFQVHAQGTVEPSTEIDLVTEVSGKLIEVSPQLDAGAYFEQGAVLARIDPRDYQVEQKSAQAALRRAQSELKHARTGLKRQQSMDAEGVTSRARLDSATNSYNTALAALREAEARHDRASLALERCELRAPFAGRVRQKFVDHGQYLSLGTPVAKIYAIDYAEIRLPVVDTELAFLDLNENGSAANPIQVILRGEYAGTKQEWMGYLVRSEGTLDRNTRMIHLVARVDDPYGRKQDNHHPPLPAGLFIDAEIEGIRRESVVRLPRSALVRDNEILVIDDDDQVERRQVRLLRAEERAIIIDEGVRANERVVVSPLAVVIDGMKVQAAERNSASSS